MEGQCRPQLKDGYAGGEVELAPVFFVWSFLFCSMIRMRSWGWVAFSRGSSRVAPGGCAGWQCQKGTKPPRSPSR